MSLEGDSKKISLTDDQQKSISKVCLSLDRNTFDPYLLHGVTGSGKTEVFIEATRHAISQGLSLIHI